jgi:hypothetical protein
MLTKKIANFSDDLLNTVRDILGEAKKCPADCECPKCEAENGMKEGYVPTADEPTDANKKTAQKVRDMMAKEKKPVKEDSHVPFDGPYKKTGEERTDEFGNKVKNVAKHLAKKAMNAQKKEEAEHNNCGTPECCGECDTAEQIDEISKATMGRYINKAKDSIDTASYRQGHKEAHGSSSKPLEKKLTKRHKGISTAVSKLTKEDAEQIDELSRKTLGNYINKANKDSVSRGIEYGFSRDKKDSLSALEKLPNRTKGIKRATDKLTKEEQDFVDSLNDADIGQIDELSKATMGSYIKKASGAEKPKNVMSPKNIPLTKIAAYQGDSETGHFGNRFNQAGYDKADRLRKNRETGIKRAADKLAKEEVEQIDELSKKTLASYAKKAMKDAPEKDRMGTALSGLAAQSASQGDREGASDFGKRAASSYTKAANRRAGMTKAIDKLAKEEVEQIDELSKKTLGSYIKKASGAAGTNPVAGKNIPLTRVHAYQSDSETGYFGKRFNQDSYDKAERLNKNRKQGITRAADKLAKEETEITEARGRPKKAGAKDFTIHPKTKEKMMHNNPEHMKRIERLQKNGILEKPKVEAGQHIMNQLSKAKTSMLGGSKINFTHGDSKHVSGTHAAKILTKYAGMKPSEKEDFQKFVGHSHENLMKHV